VQSIPDLVVLQSHGLFPQLLDLRHVSNQDKDENSFVNHDLTLSENDISFFVRSLRSHDVHSAEVRILRLTTIVLRVLLVALVASVLTQGVLRGLVNYSVDD
jgi:hypothetical protein